MKKNIVGLIIADEWEFVPFLKWAEKFEKKSFVKYMNDTVTLSFSDTTDVVAVKCGTGKVNAAFAAAYLINEYKCNIILNVGLSGAIKGVHKNEIVAGSEYIECDFDLTNIGRKPGEKPDQVYLYGADEKLIEIAKSCNIQSFVKMGSGDIFLADPVLKNKYYEQFSVQSFDMETGAIAAVCYKMKTPFLSIRKISDDCEDDAYKSYVVLNEKAEIHLSNVLEEFLNKI